MSVSRETLLNCLDAYVHPLIGRGLVAAGAVREAQPEKDHVRVHVELGFPAAGIRETLLAELAAHVGRSLGVDAALALSWRVEAVGLRKNLQALPGVRNLIAVSSGKGGVGKSTVAANLALALAAEGARVGVLDADIYGPSQPQMLGLAGQRPDSPDGKRMHPLQAYGLQVMSIGFLVDDDQPMIWRGPMATQALNQLLGETIWDDLDYLVVDMPPGTGDIQLTLSQRMPVAGAIIVTTPQDIALLDARKGLQMFRRVEIPVLGIVENMAWHVCSQCGHHEAIFGEGGGARMAAQYGSELLGQLPLELRIREQADRGKPTVAAEPDSELAQRYRDIARLAAARLAYGLPANVFPSIEISDD
ncbi:ATP-binding protein involved in chromosome partitioning [Solimonas aquatica]|uniref:Iron-sulfur cluster carrier protein n=1 Tax=Solimonas aquatica TaxID=489703 RepID=A0A1H9CL27_9GAMM|nr:iron-sulfur cluster carrier protein ApbC [Solimonas aquatica]SEQ01869.1 ATP-binding protein involved in chromosome partitioning [Solimonas aquatica]